MKKFAVKLLQIIQRSSHIIWLYSVSGIVLLSMSDIPYVNILIQPQTVFFVLLMSLYMMFRLRPAAFILVFCLYLLYGMLLVVDGRNALAASWGEYAFLIFCLSFVLVLWRERDTL